MIFDRISNFEYRRYLPLGVQTNGKQTNGYQTNGETKNLHIYSVGANCVRPRETTGLPYKTVFARVRPLFKK